MSSTPPNGKNRNPCLKGWCGKWLAESRWGSRCGICSTPPGWGFLLCVGYSAARMLLGSGKAVCFICDAAVLAVGALLYRSAAMSRFYAGQPRWYTLAGCVLCFLASPRRTGASAFRRRSVRSLVPGLAVRNAVARGAAPFAGAVSARFQRVRTAHSAGRVKKSRAARKKRLQNSGRVLYNSK